jgi:hypothetical protein
MTDAAAVPAEMLLQALAGECYKQLQGVHVAQAERQVPSAI